MRHGMSPISRAICVREFSNIMSVKLSENSHKGGWQDMAKEELIHCLRTEVRELEDELEASDGTAEAQLMIRREAADVANFAMMIADRFGGLVDHV